MKDIKIIVKTLMTLLMFTIPMLPAFCDNNPLESCNIAVVDYDKIAKSSQKYMELKKYQTQKTKRHLKKTMQKEQSCSKSIMQSTRQERLKLNNIIQARLKK